MRCPGVQTRRAILALLVVIGIEAPASADEPPPRPTATASASGAPSASLPKPAPSGAASSGSISDEICSDAVGAWAKAASGRTGLSISPVACPAGVVRLKIEGAGCDYEVRHGGGFQRTADGKLGVSPIVDMDWNTAPDPMKKGLDGVLSALAQDPSLPIRAGEPVRHGDRRPVLLGSRQNQLFAGGAVAVLCAAALGVWWKRRSGQKAPPPAA